MGPAESMPSVPTLSMWEKFAPEQLSSAAVGVTATLLLLLLPTLFLLWTRRPLKQPLKQQPPSGPDQPAPEKQLTVLTNGSGEAAPREVDVELNGFIPPPLAIDGDQAFSTLRPPSPSSSCGVSCACANHSTSTDGHEASNPAALPDVVRVPLRILYATTTGTAKLLSGVLQREAFAMNVSGFHFDVSVSDIGEYDYVGGLEHETLVVFICATWTDGTPPKSAADFFSWMDDLSKDFRVGRTLFKKVRFAIFGLGGSVYDENFCRPAMELEGLLSELGATAIHETGLGDDMADMASEFESWKSGLWPALCEQYARVAGVVSPGQQVASSSGCGSCTTAVTSDRVYKVMKSWEDFDKAADMEDDKRNAITAKVRRKARLPRATPSSASDDEPPAPSAEDELNSKLIDKDWQLSTSDDDDEDDEGKEQRPMNGGVKMKRVVSRTASNSSSGSLVEIEDLAGMVSSSSGSRGGGNQGVADLTAPREMVTPLQRKSLIKEGYKIIGSHSAVKLCRWTKHQLRGRGGCYKHTFYGITSYQCMEMTPSLACANKCVFCWRHHKNPVGKEWRWVVDDPIMIVQEGIERHQGMIKEFRGAHGVKPERLEAAFTVRHCALSLVGEPIMYPHINELVAELHRRRISTFLVTNAQFPEKIAALSPVTQLYVSIDAATKETLKTIDRPLFKDFWERYLSSLQQLRLKGQRTVYRLTLVKEWNMSEVDDYVELIAIGEPDLIEIKGVTFCGKSDASTLRMSNVPWHEEVCKFADAIASKTNGKYEFMAEHAHSCCTLLAQTKFRKEGKWHTWIDFDRFHELVHKYEHDGTEFDSTDYMVETPPWALRGSEEQGFDPVEVRVRKTRSGRVVVNEYKPTESGCG